MKIIDNKHSVPLSEIGMGECFELDGNYYMKIDSIYCLFNMNKQTDSFVLNLRSGIADSFAVIRHVNPVKIMAHLCPISGCECDFKCSKGEE